MVTDLSASAHGVEARVAPVLVALANGAAPLLMSLVVIAPLWLARAGVPLPLPPLHAAIAVAFLCIFGLGAFLGRVGGTSWLWSGAKTALIAVATVALILLLEG